MPCNPSGNWSSAARLNKVELFPSSLHGYKLLRLEPKVTSTLFHFLDTSLKNRPVDWEPQYNLTPVTFGDIPDRPATPSGRTHRPRTQAKAKDADRPRRKEGRAPPRTSATKKPSPNSRSKILPHRPAAEKPQLSTN